MKNLQLSHKQLVEEGLTIINGVYTSFELEGIISAINQVDTSKPTFRKTADLFAIRQFLKECPHLNELIFNEKLKDLIYRFFGNDYFVVKSIYFDKPEQSNWFVAFHQDLTISVDKRVELEGYGPWTVKHQQFAVQPPLNVLKSIFTIRIHLDETDENNGALKVVPGSHLKGIYRPETIDWTVEKEKICAVEEGGIMIMKPLLLHSSNRTTNNRKRRVIHIEFSNIELAKELQWAERKVGAGRLQVRENTKKEE
ncbi:phytanoyl-CoA dioxygenase family protein [Desertivirga arenae]|uniref:phytanoyl-CoA dioxygenase family protein n=1 Tax=Desertivirga arenae TaxID=2810309 RepID=UPI001A96B848|nr:phytanoyl-CoA dioxygenase family protein [Pedobacter sp. SYSU D00823]